MSSEDHQEGLTGSQKKLLAAMAIGYALAAIVVLTQNQENPAAVFLLGGLFYGGVGWLIFTKEGRSKLKQLGRGIQEASDQMQQQQQQQSGKEGAKVICQECGWRNPRTNNFCHDCGAELAQGND